MKNQNSQVSAPKERQIAKVSGWLILIPSWIFFFYSLYQMNLCYVAYNKTDSMEGILGTVIFWLIAGVVVPITACSGNIVLKPNESQVYSFMGDYKGTLSGPGYYNVVFWWTAYSSRNMATITIKVPAITVNEKSGNPIIIGCDIFCKQNDTYKATYEISDVMDYLKSKGEIALRKLAAKHHMDSTDDNDISLRGSTDEVIAELEREVTEAYFLAGYEVESAALNTLQYTPEIAGMMLQRQQAEATIKARQTIVHGVIGIIEETIETMSKSDKIDLTDAGKEKLTLTLFTTLTSHQSVTPMLEVKTS